MAQQRQDNSRQAPAVINELAPSRLPISADVAKALGVSSAEWRVLVEQLYPAAKTVESIQLVLTYCKHRNLDPFKKPCHIVPVWSSALRKMGETVWPGISELRTTAARTKSYAGLSEAEFGPTIICEFEQRTDSDDPREPARVVKQTVSYPEWCRMTAWRIVEGQRVAFTARVYWTETYATAGRFTDMPNEMWRKRPFGQIDKCTEAAVLRKAFPEELGNEYAAEEMQGRVIDDETIPFAATPEPQQPPRPPARNEDAPRSPPRPAGQQRRATDEQAAFAGTAPGGAPRREPPRDDAGTVIDGELLPPGDEDDFPGDRPDFLTRLSNALNACNDEATFSDTWEEFDAMAVLEGNADAQRKALEIKRRAYARMYGEER
jgi:phage recombination protein Bet